MLIKGVFRSKLLKGLVRNYSAVTGLNNEVHSPFEDVKLSELPYFDYVYEKVEARQNMTAVVDGLTGMVTNQISLLFVWEKSLLASKAGGIMEHNSESQ